MLRDRFTYTFQEVNSERSESPAVPKHSPRIRIGNDGLGSLYQIMNYKASVGSNVCSNWTIEVHVDLVSVKMIEHK